jgi:CBS domain-containing protein
MQVESILNTKGRRVATIRPDETVGTAAHRLKLEAIGALVVSRDGNRVDGVISERDIVWGLTQHGGELLHKRVADLMSRAVPTCSTTDSIKHVMAEMTRRRVRHLPVLDDGRLCGIVSIGDVVKNRLDEAELEANVLRDAYLRVR